VGLVLEFGLVVVYYVDDKTISHLAAASVINSHLCVPGIVYMLNEGAIKPGGENGIPA